MGETLIVKVPRQMKEINNTAKPIKCSDLKQEKASIAQAGILAFRDLNTQLSKGSCRILLHGTNKHKRKHFPTSLTENVVAGLNG